MSHVLTEQPSHATLPQIVQRAVDRYGEHVALEDERRCWTFRELQSEALKVSRAAMASGIEKGDCVAIWCPNIVEWVIVAVGLQSAGATLVPLSPSFTGHEAAEILERAGVRLLFTFPELAKGAPPVLLADKNLPVLEIVSLHGTCDGALSLDDFLARAAQISERAAADRSASITGDDVMDMLFTSGTTGKPKGVPCTHAQNIRVFETWASTVGLRSDDVYLGVNPFYHSFGYKAGWFASLLSGCAMVPLFAFDKDKVLEMIQSKGITMWSGVPSLYELILAHPARENYDLSSLRLGVTGAAVVPVSLVRQMKEVLGFETVVTAYGLTECCGVVSICRPDDDVETISSTSGRPIDGTEVKIVDLKVAKALNDGELQLRDDDVNGDIPVVAAERLSGAPVGTEGEIWVRGYNVMSGYFDNLEATRKSISQDGWLLTGDIGVMDEHGNLSITGRIKEMYIMNGQNVYPEQVEKDLAKMEGLARSAVIGVKKEGQGEVGIAFIEREADASFTVRDLMAFCRKKLADYKHPYYVEFIPKIPLLGNGKVDRNLLKSDWALRILAGER